MGRTILHADLDAFYASVEQRDDPSLRGRPVVVGGEGRRGVVATASYEARVFGVKSAMPGAEARRRCPDAVFVRPRMEVYVRIAEQVRQAFLDLTDLVEPLSLDEAFLDVSALCGSDVEGVGVEVAEELRARVHEETKLTLSVGVATCKFVAKIASDLKKPDGLVVVPADTESSFLAPLPISRLFGAGPVTQTALRSVGLETIGDLAGVPRSTLVDAVGERQAERLSQLAVGADDRPVEPDRERKSIGRETTFEVDRGDPEDLLRVLFELSDEVGRRLRRAGIRTSGLRLKLRHPPFRTSQKQRVLTRAIDDDLALRREAQALFEEAWDRKPLRLIGITATNLRSADAPQQGLLFDADAAESQKSRAFSKAKDALRQRYGDDVIR
ncbi:MAG: DNA polymerase IV [Planctomycetota bacterium]